MALHKTEDEVQQLIQMEGGKEFGSWLLRNNSGAMELPDGRFLRWGLGNTSKKWNDEIKSSDLIGPTPILITPHMVGRTMGVFTACEVKESNWTYSGTARELAQLKYLQLTQQRGGIATFAKSVDDYRSAVNNFIFAQS